MNNYSLDHLVQKWSQYATGQTPLISVQTLAEKAKKTNTDVKELQALRMREIASCALEDLNKMTTNAQVNDMFTLTHICKLMDSVERIVQCCEERCGEKFEDLMQASKTVRKSALKANMDELHCEFAIQKLQNSKAPALNALIGKDGLMSYSVLARALDINSIEVMQRCFLHAGLDTAQDLCRLFNNNALNKDNILEIIKNCLDKSANRARAQMSPELYKAFDEQWNKAVARNWIYIDGKMMPSDSLGKPERLDALDFLKKVTLDKELEQFPKNHILKNTRLFRGKKGDFYLEISNSELGKELLGKQSSKIKGAHYLWSPDGKSFHFLHNKGFGGSGNAHNVSFETKEGSHDNLVKMSVNEVYASRKNEKNQLLGRYERESLKSVLDLFDAFQNREAVILEALEYAFKVDGGGGCIAYIYVDVDAEGNYRIHRGIGVDHQSSILSKEDFDCLQKGGTFVFERSYGKDSSTIVIEKDSEKLNYSFIWDNGIEPYTFSLIPIDEKLEKDGIILGYESENARRTMG